MANNSEQISFFEKFLKIKYEYLFILLVIPYAFIMLYLTPPFQVPDEQTHFFRSYYLAEGKILPDKFETGGLGGALPKSLIIAWYASTNKLSIRFRPQNKIIPQNMEYAKNLPLNKNDRINVDFGGSRSPILFLPQAIGIKLGLLFNANPIDLLYLGRFFAFLFWAIICFLAVRTTPILKGTFILLLLTPMSVFLACSVSRDGVTNCMAFLYIAYILKLAFEVTKVRRKELIILCLLSILVALTKHFYYLCLLTIIIPPSKFKSFKSYILSILAIILIYYCTAKGWSFFVSYYYEHVNTNLLKNVQLPHHVSEPGRIGVSNPNIYEFFDVLINTLKLRSNFYLHSFIARLGWLDTYFSSFYIWFMLFSIIAVSMIDDNDSSLKVDYKRKLFLFFFFFLFFIGAHAQVYYERRFFLKLGEIKYLTELQGRYFIPLSFLPFIVFYNNKPYLKNLAKGNKIFISFVVLISVVLTIFILQSRFYA